MDNHRRDNIQRFYDYLNRKKNNQCKDWINSITREEWHRLERMMWEFSRLEISDFLISCWHDYEDDEGHWTTRSFHWWIFFPDNYELSVDLWTLPLEDEQCEEECVFSIWNPQNKLLVSDTLSLTDIVDKLISIYKQTKEEMTAGE